MLQHFGALGGEIVLEIDPPVEEVSIRRLHFYERLGFRLQPYEHKHLPYKRKEDCYSLRVMTYPMDWSEAVYQEFKQLQDTVIMAYAEGVM